MDKEIINLVNQITAKFLDFNNSLENHCKINLYQNRISHIVHNKKGNQREFYTTLNVYRTKLRDFNIDSQLAGTTVKTNVQFRDFVILEQRVKSPGTISDKIDRYMKKEKILGRVPINKCLNDLMGYRIILKYDSSLDDFLEYITNMIDNTYLSENEHFKYKINKVEIIRKMGTYQAVHLIFYRDNYTFPWEIQFWRNCDFNSNKESHSYYKQKHIGLKKTIHSVQ